MERRAGLSVHVCPARPKIFRQWPPNQVLTAHFQCFYFLNLIYSIYSHSLCLFLFPEIRAMDRDYFISPGRVVDSTLSASHCFCGVPRRAVSHQSRIRVLPGIQTLFSMVHRLFEPPTMGRWDPGKPNRMYRSLEPSGISILSKISLQFYPVNGQHQALSPRYQHVPAFSKTFMRFFRFVSHD